MTYEEAKNKLKEFGQEHLLQYYEELGEEEKQSLLSQIEKTDFSMVHFAKDKSNLEERGEIAPLSAMELEEVEKREDEFRQAGLQAIREGKVGAVLLAGGMGTRLGSDNPKCMYDIGETKPVYIMERLIANTMDVVNEAGCPIPFFIMTSEKNHDVTVAFMEEMDYFGYDKKYVFFFEQDMAPATDYDGKVLLEEKGRIATSPNGNGGWFSSMHKAGLVEKLHEMGIEWLNVFAVDNVLQRIADPVFVGATILSGAASGAKCVRKADIHEKVGVMSLEDGRPSIVEYYDMTPELLDAG